MSKNYRPQMMRAKDVSTYGSIGVSTVWLYAKQGKLTPIKVSKGITVFDRNEVENFFSKNSQYKIKDSK